MTDIQKAWSLIGSDDVPSDEVFVGYAVCWLAERYEDIHVGRDHVPKDHKPPPTWGASACWPRGVVWKSPYAAGGRTIVMRRKKLPAALAALVLAVAETKGNQS